jgi:hypothetical protein
MHRIFLALLIVWVLWLPTDIEGFNDETHIQLSIRAVSPEVSNLDKFLRTVLEFDFSVDDIPQGILQPLKGGNQGTVQLLIAEVGAVDEDWLARPIHHFHNPTKAWNQAGLWLCAPLCESSIVWSQDQNQIVGGKHSWYDARNSYYQALTATSESQRKSFYAETFTTLGYLIHLIQDAAVPAHTRDDAHLSFPWLLGGPNPDRFHFWAEEAEAVKMISGLQFPSQFPFPTSFLSNQPSANSSYPVPISRLTDTTAGNAQTFPSETTSSSVVSGGGISVSGMSFNRGLAEYSNGNFFSQDTIFPETFQFPGLSNIELRPAEPVSFATKWGPVSGNRRYFYFKPGFGETDYRLAQGSSLRAITGTTVPTDISLDPMVYADYARKLFPRAVAYSAGLIDYFFRGTLRPALVHSGPPGSGWHPVSEPPPTTITVEDIANETVNEDTGSGTVRLVLKLVDQFETNETFPPYIASEAVSVNLGRAGQNITLPFSTPLPFPQAIGGAAVYSAIVVYKGPLGQESDSVIVGACENRPYSIVFRHMYFEPWQVHAGEWLWASDSNCLD